MSKLEAEMDQVRETYEMELDAKYAAARGFVDAVIIPEETRDALRTVAAHEFELQRPAHRAVCVAADAGLDRAKASRGLRG